MHAADVSGLCRLSNSGHDEIRIELGDLFAIAFIEFEKLHFIYPLY